MVNIIPLSQLLTNLKIKAKLTTNDSIVISSAFDKNDTSYKIYVNHNYASSSVVSNDTPPINITTIAIDKQHASLNVAYIDSNAPIEFIEYIEHLSQDVIVAFDIDTIIPIVYRPDIRYDDIIECIVSTDGIYRVRVSEKTPTSLSRHIDIKYESAFEQLIHNKPLDSSEIFKTIARRLVDAGFEMLHMNVMIDNHDMSRVYKYRDIHICFFRSCSIFIGLSDNENLPTKWEEYTEIDETFLDTVVYKYLTTYWYNPANGTIQEEDNESDNKPVGDGSVILKDKSTGKDYEISVDYSELYIEEVE